MHAYLVGTSGSKANLQECEAGKPFQDLVLSDGLFPPIANHRHSLAFHGMTADGGLYPPVLLGEEALDQG